MDYLLGLALDHIKVNEKEPYVLEKGTRLCQICAPNLSSISSIEIVDQLSETNRGTCGFGSTGK